MAKTHVFNFDNEKERTEQFDNFVNNHPEADIRHAVLASDQAMLIYNEEETEEKETENETGRDFPFHFRTKKGR